MHKENNNSGFRNMQLEAQWTEPVAVSLTFHSVLSNLYTEPSICASYQISFLATGFQRRRFFLEIDQFIYLLLPTKFQFIWLGCFREEF